MKEDNAMAVIIIVYIIQVLFGVYAGVANATKNEDEHTTVAVMVFVAMLFPVVVIVDGVHRFPHVIGAFFAWLFVSFLVNEGIRLFRKVYEGDD